LLRPLPTGHNWLSRDTKLALETTAVGSALGPPLAVSKAADAQGIEALIADTTNTRRGAPRASCQAGPSASSTTLGRVTLQDERPGEPTIEVRLAEHTSLRQEMNQRAIFQQALMALNLTG
jgi:hypothetical protein